MLLTRGALFTNERTNRGDGLHRSDLVVREHDRDENRVRSQCLANVFNANDAILINR